MSDDLYIPPSGVNFRLLGYVSQEVIYTKPHNVKEPTGIAPLDDTDTSQVFTLTVGTDNHAGLYQIKNTSTTLVLYAREDQPYMDVDTQSQDYASEYTWFNFVPGTGQFAKSFRLVAPDQNQVVFSQTDQQPFLGSVDAGTFDQNQLFSFVWDRQYDVISVDYDLSLGKVLTSQPLVLANQTLTNETTTDQEMQFTVNETTTETANFVYSTGFSIELGTEFTAGLPTIGGTQFSVKATSNNQWVWGETTSYTVSYTANFPVKAKAGTTVRAVSTVNKGNLEVPFTITCKFKDTGVTVQTQGVWHGVTTWDLRHTLREYDSDGNIITDAGGVISSTGDAAGSVISGAGTAAGSVATGVGSAAGSVTSGIGTAIGKATAGLGV